MNGIEAALEHHHAGRHAEAVAIYLAVLRERPDDPDALNLLASATRSLGDADTALRLLRKAAEIAPFRADILYNLGNAAQATGHITDALAAWEEAFRLDAAYADAIANAGVALARLGRWEEAVEAYEQALRLDPGHRVSGHNIGNALGELGRGEEATERFRASLAAHPDLAEARYNLALALLRRGDYANGFAAYEARWQSRDFSHPARHTDIADWDGKPFAGKRLLIHAEQGLGDTLQFVRLVRMAATLGGAIVLEVPAALVPLLGAFRDVAEVVPETAAPERIDLQVPLLGLPHRLGLTLGSVPGQVPYLAGSPERIGRWQSRLASDRRPVVGLCWRGNPKSPADRGRSLRDPSVLAPLEGVEGVRFVSLMRHREDELERMRGGLGWRVRGLPLAVEHGGPEFDAGEDAFLDTAALMTQCAAVVTTDTSVAHLAGALGRPTVTLLKKVPDWRWLTDIDWTPWYPTVVLARQERADDWEPVVERAAQVVRQKLGL